MVSAPETAPVASGTMITVLWRRCDGSGMDRCQFATTPEGKRIAGTALGLLDGRSYEIRYSVLTDPEWRTRMVGVHVQSSRDDRGLALRTDGRGTWSVSDEPVIELYGAIDAALAWSPATHTLPLSRLALDVGQAAEVKVALVTYPERTVHRVTNSYERLSDDGYRFATPGFTSLLEVDDLAVVTAVPGLWEAVVETRDDL